MALKYFDVTGSDPLSSGDDVCLSSNVGKVGIGTTSPTAGKLVVFGATQDAIQTILRVSGNNASNQEKAFDIKLTASTPEYLITTAAVGTDPKLSFSTAGASAEMTIASGGNVGIGTTSPGAKLEIMGANAAASSYAKALSVTDGSSHEMFLVQDGLNGSSDNVTVFNSAGGQMIVTPKHTNQLSVQDAIDFLESQGDKGGIVFLPAGEYEITTGLTIGDGRGGASYPRGSGIQIIGAGAHLTILKINDSANERTGIKICGGTNGSSGAEVSQNVVIKDLQIRTNNDDMHTGIEIEYACDMLIENVRIGIEADSPTKKFKYGIKVTSWGNTIHSCQICGITHAGILLTDAAITGGAATIYSQANSTKIINCGIVEFFKSGAITVGIDLADSVQKSIVSNVITGCTIQANETDDTIGIRTNPYVQHTYIAGNHFEANEIGIKIVNQGNTIVGNYHASTCLTPIDIDSSYQAGNVVWGNYHNEGTIDNYYLYGSVGIGTASPASKLEISGSLGLKVVTKTSAYTAADETIILGNASSGAVNITLPVASTVTGRIYYVKKIDNNANVNILRSGTDLIDGNTSQTLSTQYACMQVASDGSNWYIIAQK